MILNVLTCSRRCGLRRVTVCRTVGIDRDTVKTIESAICTAWTVGSKPILQEVPLSSNRLDDGLVIIYCDQFVRQSHCGEKNHVKITRGIEPVTSREP